MSFPKQNATPEQMAALSKLNKKLYGTKPEMEPRKPISGSIVNTGLNTGIDLAKALSSGKLSDVVSKAKALPVVEGSNSGLQEITNTNSGSLNKVLMPTPPRPTRPDPMPQMPTRPDPMPSPGEMLPTSMQYKKGGSVPSASKRGDGIAQRGKTKGRMC